MTFKDKLIIFFRSFLLQAGWNYMRFQGLGFGFVMLPYLKKLYSRANLNMVFTRYLETFNTHPIMASYSYGALAKIEENIKEAKATRMDWTMTKNFINSSLASIGDRFFWDTLRPLSFMFGVFTALTLRLVFYNAAPGPGVTQAQAFVIICAVLLSYNIPALYVKWKGVNLAYNSDKEDTFGLTNFDWNKAIRVFKKFGRVAVIAVICYAVYVNFVTIPFGPIFILVSTFVVFAVFLSSLAARFNIPCVYIYFLLVAVFCTGAFLI